MKKALLFAAVLLAAGILITAAVLFLIDFDFAKLTTDKTRSLSQTVSGEFLDIQLDLDSVDVEFKLSEDGTCRVEGTYPESMPITATVEDGGLVIRQEDQRKWYHHIGIFPNGHKVTVYLPDIAYGDLSVSTSTGDITIPQGFVFCTDVSLTTSTGDISFFAATLNLNATASTGDVQVKNVKTDGNISISVSTGDIFLENVVCKQLSIETSTGDVGLKASDGERIEINTDTGDVEGSLLTNATYIVETSTGKVLVPKTEENTSKICKITTSTGDIHITIE